MSDYNVPAIARRELLAGLRWIAADKARGEEIVYRHVPAGALAADRTPILLAKSRRETAIARDFYQAVLKASNEDEAWMLMIAYRRQQGGTILHTAYLYAPYPRLPDA